MADQRWNKVMQAACEAGIPTNLFSRPQSHGKCTRSGTCACFQYVVNGSLTLDLVLLEQMKVDYSLRQFFQGLHHALSLRDGSRELWDPGFKKAMEEFGLILTHEEFFVDAPFQLVENQFKALVPSFHIGVCTGSNAGETQKKIYDILFSRLETPPGRYYFLQEAGQFAIQMLSRETSRERTAQLFGAFVEYAVSELNIKYMDEEIKFANTLKIMFPSSSRPKQEQVNKIKYVLKELKMGFPVPDGVENIIEGGPKGIQNYVRHYIRYIFKSPRELRLTIFDEIYNAWGRDVWQYRKLVGPRFCSNLNVDVSQPSDRVAQLATLASDTNQYLRYKEIELTLGHYRKHRRATEPVIDFILNCNETVSTGNCSNIAQQGQHNRKYTFNTSREEAVVNERMPFGSSGDSKVYLKTWYPVRNGRKPKSDS